MTRDDENITEAQPLPPHETTASPVEVSVVMPRYFGITPPTLLFGIATATLAIAITLAILARWVAALVLAALVLVELALFVGLARRKPDTAVAKASVRAIDRFGLHVSNIAALTDCMGAVAQDEATRLVDGFRVQRLSTGV